MRDVCGVSSPSMYTVSHICSYHIQSGRSFQNQMPFEVMLMHFVLTNVDEGACGTRDFGRGSTDRDSELYRRMPPESQGTSIHPEKKDNAENKRFRVYCVKNPVILKFGICAPEG